MPNVCFVWDCDSEVDSLEVSTLAVVSACCADKLLADATDAAEAEEADSSLIILMNEALLLLPMLL